MRGVVAVALALLVSTVASGCFVEDKDPETQDTTGTGTASKSGTTTGAKTTTTTGNGTGSPNQAPTANLTATPANGTAPLNVTFVVSGTDADSDALNWTLTSGNATLASGNGTTLPSNVTHQFTEAGNFTVVLTVTDGSLDALAKVTVTVGVGDDAGAVEPSEDDWVVFNADGTCDAKDEIDVFGEYVHERGDPPGTGYVNGDGTWIYEESNGIDGLQVGGAGETAAYQACLNPDFLVF